MDSSAAARGGRIVLVNTATQATVMLDADAIAADPPPPPPLPRAPPWRAAIGAMRTVEAAEGEGEECAVCLEELGSGLEMVKEVGCGHRFHGGCIERWVGMRGTCPVCRVRVSAVDEAAAAAAAAAAEMMRRRREGVWIAIAIGR